MSSENGSASAVRNIEKCSLVLVDVAGTTTSINFLKDTLFPFAVKEAEAFLQAKWDDKTVKECIEAIKDKDELDVKTAAERIKALTEENSSNEGFKKLQGLIYENGYEKEDLKAHVFEDVPEMFGIWAQSKKIAVYSTGSVDSQKQLFSHTILGDLTNHITAYFDQGIGLKTDSESYKKIAKEMEVEAEDIVFITDDLKEAEAAKTCGVQAVLIFRDENTTADEAKFTVITSFKNLTFEKVVKRKNEDQSNTEERPAKIVKTDEIKTEVSSKADKIENAQAIETKAEEDEKMDVEEKPDSKKTDELENKKTDTSQNEEIEKMAVDATVEANDSVEVKEATTTEAVPSPPLKSVVEEASLSKEEASESKIDVVESVTKTDASKSDVAETDSKVEAIDTTDSTDNACNKDKLLNSTSDQEGAKNSNINEEKVTQPISKSDEKSESNKDCELESQSASKEKTEIVEDKSLPEESGTESTKKVSDSKNDCSQTKNEEMEVVKDDEAVLNAEIDKSQEEDKTEENRAVSGSKVMDVEEAVKTSSVKDKSSEAEDKKECKRMERRPPFLQSSEKHLDWQCLKCGTKYYETEKDSNSETEKQEVNGDDKPIIETTTTSVKTDEKENNSVLANGVENGKNENEAKENTSETVQTKPDGVEEPEVKVKKLEEVVDSSAVSVEA